MYQQKPLCIYHNNCADGFTAAWIVKRFFLKHEQTDIDFHGAKYGRQAPESARDRLVIIVDFSYSKAELEQMAGNGCRVLVLDHHKSAAADLADVPKASDWKQFNESGEPVMALFDMQRSGAGITWDFFFPDMARPTLVDIVEDRDLWRFAIPGSREATATIFSYEYTFRNWDTLSCTPTKQLVDEGKVLNRKHMKDIKELLQVVERRIQIDGHVVPAANLPYMMGSEAGAIMAKGHPFAASYYDTPTERVFSLRSVEGEGLDVSEICRKYGGGGHANASGMRMSHERVRQLHDSGEMCFVTPYQVRINGAEVCVHSRDSHIEYDQVRILAGKIGNVTIVVGGDGENRMLYAGDEVELFDGISFYVTQTVNA